MIYIDNTGGDFNSDFNADFFLVGQTELLIPRTAPLQEQQEDEIIIA